MPRADTEGPAPSKGQRTRQRILLAAAGELSRRGYDGTSLRAVAEGAGLHLGSLYFHFSSKEELVGAAMADGIDFAHAYLQKALGDLPADTDPGVRFRTAIRSHLEALHADRDRGMAVVRMASTLPPELRVAFARNEHHYGMLWLDVITAAQQAGVVDPDLDARQMRDLLIGALNSTLSTVRADDGALTAVAETAYRLWSRPA